MITRLDHVVVGVRDLDEAIQNYQQLGFEVRPGGRHTGLGTHNALIRFGLDYLELLATYNESEVTQSAGPGQFMTEYLRGHPGARVGKCQRSPRQFYVRLIQASRCQSRMIDRGREKEAELSGRNAPDKIPGKRQRLRWSGLGCDEVAPDAVYTARSGREHRTVIKTG